MSNTHAFYLSSLDEIVAALPPEERRQIMRDYDEYERTGKSGDTRLRHHSGEIYRRLQGKPSGFDATYMMFVGLSAHKIASIEALREAEDLTQSDRKTLSLQLVQDLAQLVPSHRDETHEERADRLRQIGDQIDDMITRARTIVGFDPEQEPDPHTDPAP